MIILNLLKVKTVKVMVSFHNNYEWNPFTQLLCAVMVKVKIDSIELYFLQQLKLFATFHCTYLFNKCLPPYEDFIN